jgi:hypothetical protein
VDARVLLRRVGLMAGAQVVDVVREVSMNCGM